MGEVTSFLAANPTWIAIAVTAIGVVIAGLNLLGAHRDRKRKSHDGTPDVKAIINATTYDGGWRSVQLHIVPPAGHGQAFQYEQWCIEGTQLLRPRRAVLARARGDDYAAGDFLADRPVRALRGKAEGRPQRFALEFFIKFEAEQRERKAEFKVAFSDTNGQRRATKTIWATLPGRA